MMSTTMTRTPANAQHVDWMVLHRETPWERIQRIKVGLPVYWLDHTALALGIPMKDMALMLGIGRSARKGTAVATHLATDASERLLGLMCLVGQVQTIVAESGKPCGFDAGRWLGNWLLCPQAALQGRKPSEFLDTVQGQLLLSGLLLQMQHGGVA